MLDNTVSSTDPMNLSHLLEKTARQDYKGMLVTQLYTEKATNQPDGFATLGKEKIDNSIEQQNSSSSKEVSEEEMKRYKSVKSALPGKILRFGTKVIQENQ